MAPKEFQDAAPTTRMPSNASRSTSSTNQKPTRPLNFRDAVTTRTSRPLAVLFQLGIRVMQFVFALASGISYAIELSHNNSSGFIYSQVVFGFTLLMLIIEAITLRSYKLVFLFESIICILWLALFGTFYTIYFGRDTNVEPEYAGVNMSRMRNAVWLDLINFLLWLASALFSTVMCCSGTKAMLRGKWRNMKTKRRGGKDRSVEDRMETGVVQSDPPPYDERLPTYEVIAAAAGGRL